jgi:hypothetical protein
MRAIRGIFIAAVLIEAVVSTPAFAVGMKIA